MSHPQPINLFKVSGNSPPIREVLDLLFTPEQVIQLQINTGEIFLTGHYDNRDALTKDVLEIDGQYPALYVTLNPFQGHPPTNSIHRFTEAVKADQILRRVWLLVDFDPARKSGTNATDEEKATAYALLLIVAAHLKSLGWAEGIICDSGNGYHLLYRIDLLNDSNSETVVHSTLAGLSEKFSTPQVKIDRLWKAQQITKLYGTMTKKGEHSTERPQRRSNVLFIPASLEIVTLEQLQMIQPTTPVDAVVGHTNILVKAERIFNMFASQYPASEHEELRLSIRGQLEGPYVLEELKDYLDTMGYTYGAFTPWKGGVRTFLGECYDKDGVLHEPPKSTHQVSLIDGVAGHDCKVCEVHEGKISFYKFRVRNYERNKIIYRFPSFESPVKTNEVLSSASEPEPDPNQTKFRTELGNAERLIQRHGNDIRHIGHRTRGEWAVWDNRRWKLNSDRRAAERMKETVRSILDEARDLGKKAQSEKEKEDAEELFKWALRSQTDKIIQASLKVASSDARISLEREDMNNSSMLLNLDNGTLDLNTIELREHNREDNLTTVSTVEYNPSATCPGFLKFIERILPDPEVRAFVQRWLGLCLTDDNGEQAMCFWYGEGSNGKSQLLELTRKILGSDYAKKASFDTFRLGQKGETRNDLARLHGARLVYISEAGEGVALDEATLKDVTGGEAIACRFMYKEHFEFIPTFKPTFATNHKPEILGTDYAIWRRIYMVPFEVTIPEAEREKNINVRLFREESSGILNWMLEGLRDYRNVGLNAPEVVTAATETYQEEQDTVGHFIEERCDADLAKARLMWNCPNQVPNTELYRAYSEWMVSFGYRPVKSRRLERDLSRRGFRKDRNRGGVVWFGLKLRGASPSNHTPEKPKSNTYGIPASGHLNLTSGKEF